MEAQLGWRRPPTLASAGQYRVRCLDRMQGGVRRGMSCSSMRAYRPGAVTSTEVTGQSGQSKLHLATQHERQSRMAGRGTCCGTAQAEPGAPGSAGPARAGGRRRRRTGGKPGAEAATHYTSWLRWRRARADIATAPVMTGAGVAAPVEDRRRRTSRGPQAES